MFSGLAVIGPPPVAGAGAAAGGAAGAGGGGGARGAGGGRGPPPPPNRGPPFPGDKGPPVWRIAHPLGPIDPGRGAVGEGGPVVRLAPDQQPAARPLLGVAVLKIEMLVLQTIAHDRRYLVAQRLETEREIAGALRGYRGARLAQRRPL